MANGKFVAYYRVSSRKQGKSGLGLGAQRESVQTHLNGGRWKMVAEFVEVESGKRKNRPKLAEALSLCRAYGATLIIAKLDRLARNVAFISALMEAGVEFIAVDMPTANKFTVHIMAAVAEQEADMIAERTRKALATARARGTQLGRRDDAIALHAKAGNRASAEVRSETAHKRANDLLPVIAKAKESGARTLREIADKLNEWGTPTVSKRGGRWSAVQVQRVCRIAG